MTGVLCTFWPFYQWSRKCSPFRSMNCLTFRISPLQSVDSCWSLFSLLYSVLWTIILSFFIWFVLFCFLFYGFFLLGLLGQRAPEIRAWFTWVVIYVKLYYLVFFCFVSFFIAPQNSAPALPGYVEPHYLHVR